MKKEVIIEVTGKQINQLGDTDLQEFVTTGQYFLKNGAYYIIYNESVITGMEGTSTVLKAEGSRVSLNRMGANQYKQVFETGLNHQGYYVTPYGTMCMSVSSSKVEVDLTETGGRINLEYELEVDGQKLSSNLLRIKVREA